MKVWTYAEAKAKIEKDLDLQEENWITDSELMEYFNDAIDEAESEIHKLGLEDEYFLDSAPVALTEGETDYDLPANIFANKIREIVYDDGATRYDIRRLRGPKRFLQKAEIDSENGSPDYRYLIKHPSGGYKLVLVPASRETSTANVTMWFIRNANRLTTTTDEIDIPEFIGFLFAHVKRSCKAKEGILSPADLDAVEKQRKLMIETLTEMVPDEDNEIVGDASFYDELS